MSTTPEDNPGPQNSDKAPEEGGRPTFEPAGPTAPGTEEARPEYGQEGAHSFEGETAAYQDQEAAYQGEESAHEAPVEPRPGGAFSAETFAVVGLVLLGVTVMSGRLIEMLTSMILVGGQAIAPEQVSHIELQLMAGGAVALLTVLFAGLSLTLTNLGTRPWAKWGATATLIVGLLFVITAAVAYYLMPEAAEPMVPPIFD